MNIKMQKADQLIPYINNPRNNDSAVDAVASSIKNFGFKVPIVVDKDNEIIAGHTRLLAAKKLGYDEVPTIVAEDLDENQVRAFRLADNKVSELAEWDMDLLENEIRNIEDVDMESFGFGEMLDDFDLQDIEEDDYEDDNSLTKEEPLSKLGEIYQLGSHRLMCGDSTKSEDVSKLMDGVEADLVVTDPPYNVGYTGGKTVIDGKLSPTSTGKNHQSGLYNDNLEDDEFIDFLTKSFSNIKNNLKKGGAFYIWHADVERYAFEKSLRKNGLFLRQTLIWAKPHFAFGRQDYQWKHEPCLYGWRDGGSHYFTDDRTHTTVVEDKPNINHMSKEELKDYSKELLEYIDLGTTLLREPSPNSNDMHPTMKPVKLLAHGIRNSSRKGEIVLDLFGGSGSTLIACEQLNRSCRMMEFEPMYVDVIINRWEKMTGEKAQLIQSVV